MQRLQDSERVVFKRIQNANERRKKKQSSKR